MTIPFTPAMPSRPKVSDHSYQSHKSAVAPLREADRRRRFRRHRVRLDEDPFHADGMLPYASVEGDAVTVVLPRSFCGCPPEVACETVCWTFRRMTEPGLPVFGPTTSGYFVSDWFRRCRARMLGEVGASPHMSGFLRRTGTRMTRLEARFVSMMEGPLAFLGAMMRVRAIGMVPLSDAVPEPRYATYSDPYMRLVLYDPRAMDPVRDEPASMVLMFRACAYVECYDLRAHRLDMDRFLLMLSMYPGYGAAMRHCDEEGYMYPDWEREERRLLPCGTTRTS